jgi:hypothetical protein
MSSPIVGGDEGDYAPLACGPRTDDFTLPVGLTRPLLCPSPSCSPATGTPTHKSSSPTPCPPCPPADNDKALSPSPLGDLEKGCLEAAALAHSLQQQVQQLEREAQAMAHHRNEPSAPDPSHAPPTGAGSPGGRAAADLFNEQDREVILEAVEVPDSGRPEIEPCWYGDEAASSREGPPSPPLSPHPAAAPIGGSNPCPLCENGETVEALKEELAGARLRLEEVGRLASDREGALMGELAKAMDERNNLAQALRRLQREGVAQQEALAVARDKLDALAREVKHHSQEGRAAAALRRDKADLLRRYCRHALVAGLVCW